MWAPLLVLSLLCGTGVIGYDYQTVYMTGSCGSSISLSDSGYISWSSSWNYGDNEDCSVVFHTSSPGAIISLQFLQINIENSDHLFIYNGAYYSTPSFTSSDYVNNNNILGQFYSTGDSITLRLVSDGSVGGTFQLLYTRTEFAPVTSDHVRLVDGSVNNEGRVEVRLTYGSDWGTVCDDGFDMNDAAVVCRSLGYVGASEYRSSASFGQGSGSIYMDDLECTGTEKKLLDCSYAGWGNNNCGHNEDVGVVCQLPRSTSSGCSGFHCNDGFCISTALECDGVVNCGDQSDEHCDRIRLVGGSGAHEGRLEVRPAGGANWGTVCDDQFDISDATVACRMLGYSEASEVRSSAYYGQGSGDIYMDDLQCSGHETSLFDCSYAGWGVENCGHSEDVGVVCGSPGIQLSGGAIAGIVIGVLIGVGLLAVIVHHIKKTSSSPTPANRVNPNPQTVRMNNTTFHRPAVVSQNPPYNPQHQPYPPPQQYPPPPAYDAALSMSRQPPSGPAPYSYSSQDPAYAPPPEPFRYGMR